MNDTKAVPYFEVTILKIFDPTEEDLRKGVTFADLDAMRDYIDINKKFWGSVSVGFTTNPKFDVRDIPGIAQSSYALNLTFVKRQW
jgi:hypothetical protein